MLLLFAYEYFIHRNQNQFGKQRGYFYHKSHGIIHSQPDKMCACPLFFFCFVLKFQFFVNALFVYIKRDIKNNSNKKKKFLSRHTVFISSSHHRGGGYNLCPRHNTPGTDLVVSVTSEESLAVSAPGQADALGLAALLALLDVLGLELVNLALLLEVEDGDAGGGGSAEPVAVGGEDEGVDLVTGVEGVEVLGLVEVPEHGGTVLAAGGAEGAIGGDGDGVDVAGVTDVVGLDTAGGELPNLFA